MMGLMEKRIVSGLIYRYIWFNVEPFDIITKYG